MNNTVKEVALSPHVLNDMGEYGQSDLLLFLKSPITIEGIKKDIRKLKCKRAAGVDGIAAEFYKHGCNELFLK